MPASSRRARRAQSCVHLVARASLSRGSDGRASVPPPQPRAKLLLAPSLPLALARRRSGSMTNVKNTLHAWITAKGYDFPDLVGL